MNKFLAVFITLFFIFQGCDPAYAGPKEPPLSEMQRWYAMPDGTVILEYRIITKYSAQIWRFKHAQKATAERAPACNEIVVDGDEIKLLTQEKNPHRYLIKKENDGSAPEFALDFSYDQW